MKIHTLKAVQKLPISIDEAWNFFANPNNLKVITPPYMGFEVISGGEEKMFPGQIIQYYVKPLAGIKIRWTTEITHVSAPVYFVDEQRFGPYSFWHHKHFFKEIPGGIEMTDVVDYALPLGVLVRWMHSVVVRPKLEEIFTYRKRILEELYGKMEIKKGRI